jgi:4a-hydroxytetrahydrobiopterin dehydratase
LILTNKQLDVYLEEHNDWSIVNEKLSKTFKFSNFIQAFGFMTEVAITSEAMDHHPEWSNVYNRVEINLITHSEGGITKLDTEIASPTPIKRIGSLRESEIANKTPPLAVPSSLVTASPDRLMDL